MSEKRFITGILIEGIILMVLGLCTVIIPKLTELSFGVMLSCAFMTYGLYKIFHSIFYKNYNANMLLCLFMGIYLLTIGILLLLVPKISLLWLIALTGVYFILESISTTAFASQIRNLYNMWGCKMIVSMILFVIGVIIILGIPVISFWAVSTLCGLGFLIKGTSKVLIYLINKNNYV